MDEDERLRNWIVSRIAYHEHLIRTRRAPSSTDAATHDRSEAIELFHYDPFSPQGKPH
jgi:hypothetical protein